MSSGRTQRKLVLEGKLIAARIGEAMRHAH